MTRAVDKGDLAHEVEPGSHYCVRPSTSARACREVQQLHVDRNRISRIENLSAFKHLRCLYLQVGARRCRTAAAGAGLQVLAARGIELGAAPPPSHAPEHLRHMATEPLRSSPTISHPGTHPRSPR